jgi:CHAD domain-containing protein
MESPRHLALLVALDRLESDPPFRAEASTRAKDAVPAPLRKDAKRLRRRVAAAASAPQGHSQDIAFHECRKAAKRLRYAAETARPVLGKDAKRLTAAAKATQKLLGKHQDSVVARAALRELGVQAQLDGDSAFTFGLLYGTEQPRAALLEKEFHHVWRAKTLPSLRGVSR